ncbi:hypothetical protein [Aureivirga marina]|uniref:hypothetical protein n=1 Tax=Aureivirga marina TaxID=1182451 RepID=UPI0018CB3EFF|nr:hypothetical protein [Aureivirga marina]
MKKTITYPLFLSVLILFSFLSCEDDLEQEIIENNVASKTSIVKIANGNSDLKNKLNAATAGTIIKIKDIGKYTGDFEISKNGTASNPIIIEAESGRPEFKDALFIISGNHIILKGMDFNNSTVEIFGNNNRVTRNEWRNGKEGGNGSRLDDACHVSGSKNKGQNNRIDHNYLHDWKRRGFRIIDVKNSVKNNRIDHNYIKNLVNSSYSNSGEALQAGTDASHAKYSTNTIFEYNLIENFSNDSEVISLKSSGNIFRYNTVKNATSGSISCRAGNNQEIRGNTLRNVQFIRTYGEDHLIIANYLDNCQIKIMSGPIYEIEHFNNSQYKACPGVSKNVTIVKNKAQQSGTKMRIGADYIVGNCSLNNNIKTKNIKVYQNTNFNIQKEAHGESIVYLNSYSGNIGTHVELSPADVGLNAPEDSDEDDNDETENEDTNNSDCTGELSEFQIWKTKSFNSQTDNFSASCNVTITGNSVKGAITLADGNPTTWSENACIIKFTNQVISVYNETSYTDIGTFDDGDSFDIKFEVNVPSKTYNVYIDNALKASNLKFRNQAPTETQINHWGLFNNIQNEGLCIKNRSISGNSNENDSVFNEENGQVVFEAEDYFQKNQREDDVNWQIKNSISGAVGEYVETTNNASLNNSSWENACELTYKINFSTTGNYKIWFRGYSINGGSNSAYGKIDGTSEKTIGTSTNNSWQWKAASGTINVNSSGVKTFRIRRREAGFKIDRIVITKNGNNPNSLNN